MLTATITEPFVVDLFTKFQIKIASTEATYNDVIPPPSEDTVDVKIKAVDQFFDDEDFMKASDYVNDMFEVEQGSDDVSVNNEVGDRRHSRPRNSSLTKRKLKKPTLNFEDVDDYARKVVRMLKTPTSNFTSTIKTTAALHHIYFGVILSNPLERHL